jgi:hypothetical protein
VFGVRNHYGVLSRREVSCVMRAFDYPVMLVRTEAVDDGIVHCGTIVSVLVRRRALNRAIDMQSMPRPILGAEFPVLFKTPAGSHGQLAVWIESIGGVRARRHSEQLMSATVPTRKSPAAAGLF